MRKYSKIINLLGNKSNQLSRFRTKNWIGKMINQEECIISIVTLDSKLQCQSLVYVIIAMHTCLLKEE